jgi:hypothetical protein
MIDSGDIWCVVLTREEIYLLRILFGEYFELGKVYVFTKLIDPDYSPIWWIFSSCYPCSYRLRIQDSYIFPGCATVNAIEARATIAPSSPRNTGSSLILGLPHPPAISGIRYRHRIRMVKKAKPIAQQKILNRKGLLVCTSLVSSLDVLQSI